jgi:hypothetical protein
MKAPTTASSFLMALVLALTLPAGAAAQEEGSVVPPENSAATQYTEAVPTAGGDKQAGGGHKPSPAKVLGDKNAHKLQSQGKDGREVAQVVAETAPETSPPVEASERPEVSSAQAGGDQAGGNSGGDGSGKGGHPSLDKADHQQTSEPPAAQPSELTSSTLPDGSSGLGEVIGEATGSSSSGGLGLLLPLAIVAAIAWALACFWRQRRPAE